MHSPRLPSIAFGFWISVFAAFQITVAADLDEPPIRALIVTGGGIHDYGIQSEILTQGIGERVNREIEWEVCHQGLGGSDEEIPLFQNAEWSQGYDIVVHNYCFPGVTNPEYIDQILAPHREGLPAILLHATMQSFRVSDERWFEFCGVRARGNHAPGAYAVEWLLPENPILRGVQPWMTPAGGLFPIEKVWPGVTKLADGVHAGDIARYTVAWTHQFGPKGSRVFGTTIGSDAEIMREPQYLDLVARGFLWAMDDLSEVAFKKVSREESLRSLDLTQVEVEPLQPGPNYALHSQVRGWSVPGSGGQNTEVICDGDVKTGWGPGKSVPFSVELSLQMRKKLGAVAVFWEGDGVDRYSIEGSHDGTVWKWLGFGGRATSGSDISLHEFPSAELGFLRLNVSEPGISRPIRVREIAAYESAEDVPSAILIRQDPPDEPLFIAGADEWSREIRIRDDWSVVPVEPMGADCRVKQLVGTGDGRALAFCIEAQTRRLAEPLGSIYSISPRGEEGFEKSEFLHGIPAEGAFTWDGEWVYILSCDRGAGEGSLPCSLRLQAFRDTNDDRVADERFQLGAIKILSEGPSGNTGATVVVDYLMIGSDSMFYAIIETAESASVYHAQTGARAALPGYSVVRFDRDMERLDILVRSTRPLDGLGFDAEGNLLVWAGGEGDESNLYLCSSVPGTELAEMEPLQREVGSLTGINSWGRDETITTLNRDGKGYLILRGQLIEAEQGGEVAEMPFASKLAVDGSGGCWLLVRHSSGSERILLFRPNRNGNPSVAWDEIADRDIPAYFDSDNSVIRFEAPQEMRRRKRSSSKELNALIPDSFRSLAEERAWLSAVLPEGDLEVLIESANSESPLERAMAYRLLGDRSDSRNLPEFASIESERNPIVSAEILGALMRTGKSLEGLDELILGFVAFSDPILAAASRSFLQQRRAHETCFSVLDNTEKDSLWPATFEVLSRMPETVVVEGLIDRVVATSSARFRRLGISALAELYRRESNSHRNDEGKSLVSDYLNSLIGDPRVDQAFLLDELVSSGILLRDLDELVKFAPNLIPIESQIIELLEDRSVSGKARSGLIRIAKDEHRDIGLRVRALTALSTVENLDVLKGCFSVMTRLDLSRVLDSDIGAFMQCWFGNSLHEGNVGWLIREAKGSDSERSALAWRTLLHLDEQSDDTVEIGKAIESVITSGGTGLLHLLLGLSEQQSHRSDQILAAGAESDDPRVKALMLDLSNRPATASPEDSPPLSLDGLGLDDLEDLLALESGDAKQGLILFRSAGCGHCHKLHGEGPSLAPNLADSVGSMSPADLAMAIIDPAGDLAEEATMRLFELENGQRLRGLVNSRSSGTISLIDRGGNTIEIPEVRVRHELATQEALMPCSADLRVSSGEIASLVAFLRSLGESVGNSGDADQNGDDAH